jgi:hypothetical protein
MKFDAEFVKKNFFWLLLAATSPMILIALIIIGPVVGSAIATEDKKITDAASELEKKGKDVKNKKDVKTAAEKAKQYKQEEVKQWKKAYQGQRKLMVWPAEFEEKYQFQNGIFAKKIVATRPKVGAAPPPPPAAAGMKMPAEEPPYAPGKLTGVITKDGAEDGKDVTEEGKDVTEDWINVAVDQETAKKDAKDGKPGKDKDKDAAKTDGKKKAPTIVRIYNTKKAKVTLDGKDVSPKALKEHDRVEIEFDVGKYFGDSFTDKERTYFRASYTKQIHAILRIVQPIDTKGLGVVQLGDWQYKKDDLPVGYRFFNFLASDWNPDPDDYKEFWTAQEDMWIQKELYQLIAQANDAAANFDKHETDKGPVFTNARWQIQAILDKKERRLSFTVKNALPNTQEANVTFEITYQIQKPGDNKKPGKKTDLVTKKLEVQGGPLAAGADFHSEHTIPEGATEIVAIKQILTWDTAAVRRIDEISIGGGSRPGDDLGKGFGAPPKDGKKAGGRGGSAKSNRTFPGELKSLFKPKISEKAAAGGPGGPGPGADQGGKKDMKTEAAISVNGIDFQRYSELTPQARRVPVALVLIIDQNDLSRVLTSFTNSELRFMTNQILLNRSTTKIIPPKSSASGSGNKTSGQFRLPPGFGKGMLPPDIFSGKGRPPGGFSPSGLGEGFQAADSTADLMELVIYGTVTLYERFPARGKSD